MFVGWKGSPCAYLLIGFYYTKKSANDAGKKAFIVKPRRRLRLLCSALMLFMRFGSIDSNHRGAAAGLTPGSDKCCPSQRCCLSEPTAGSRRRFLAVRSLLDAEIFIHAATMVTA